MLKILILTTVRKKHNGVTNMVLWFILQIIALSASANKLSKLQERAEEYAALIMEELDPDNFGFIEVCILF